jgi:uncharacterized protein
MKPAAKEHLVLREKEASPNQQRVQVAGTELVLMASRMAWWPEEKALFLADTHFGKAATFRSVGIPVPAGTTERMLAQLSNSLDNTSARRLLILGDFIHSSTRSQRDFECELLAWRQRHASLPITLIRGNHDRHFQQIFSALDFKLETNVQLGPFKLCHDPMAAEDENPSGPFRLGGHIHPGFPLRDRGAKMLPCFWLGRCFLVLPAFGCFTGLAKIKPATDDSVFAIHGDEIAQVHPPLFKRHL